MANYYFLAASLPSLAIDEKPDVTFEELSGRLEINLSKEDAKQARVLKLYIDLCNIRSMLMEESIDPRGNFDEKSLDEAMLLKDGLPDYVFDFLERFSSIEEKLKNFSGIFSIFFNEEIQKNDGFLKRFFVFERNFRLVMLALRSKRLHRDIMRELQFEDFSDPLVAQIIAQKDADDFQPPAEFVELKEKFNSCGGDPWLQHKVVSKWQFDQIDQLVEKPLFSIEWILAFMARLFIVENGFALDEQKGKMILQAFIT